MVCMVKFLLLPLSSACHTRRERKGCQMSEYESSESGLSRREKRRLVLILAVACAVAAGCLCLAWLIGR